MVKQVATHIGPFARPGMIVGTPGLPKTRSGEYVLCATVLAGVVCVQFWLMVVGPAVDGVEFPLCCCLVDSPLMACFDHSYFCLCQFLACSLGHSDGGAPCSLSVGTDSLVAPCIYTHRWGQLAAHAWVGRDFSGESLFAGLMVFSPLRRVTARNLTSFVRFALPCLALPFALQARSCGAFCARSPKERPTSWETHPRWPTLPSSR